MDGAMFESDRRYLFGVLPDASSGIVQLDVRYPVGSAVPHQVEKRPPVSRVREIRMHGLKGILARTHRRIGDG
jgi:hypothetical protein